MIIEEKLENFVKNKYLYGKICNKYDNTIILLRNRNFERTHDQFLLSS